MFESKKHEYETIKLKKKTPLYRVLSDQDLFAMKNFFVDHTVSFQYLQGKTILIIIIILCQIMKSCGLSILMRNLKGFF